ncbi:uncharacterized protein LODBEIA_P32280 [Lodderomyces beijingensis]|uniref:Translin n=1 Tax=Lodderomyces beijingensis TaxID=1775926 RepID=A0ABP0ZM69_9ASCO
MIELDQFFADISDEIAKDVSDRASLQDLEHRFDLSLIPYHSKINSWTSTIPTELNDVFKETFNFEEELKTNLAKFNTELSGLECKSSQRESLSNKFVQDSIFVVLSNRYFWVLAMAYTTAPITIHVVTSGDNCGIVATPKEIFSALGVNDINYQSYLLALLKLTDVLVDYTTATVINQSIGSENSASPNYTLGLINSNIVSKLQNGFSLLDLKNDALRKRYDGLKYSSQKLNKIVYDLSLRNLITTTADIL